MQQHAPRGYVGLLMLLVTAAIIGFTFYYLNTPHKAADGTTTPGEVQQARLDVGKAQDVGALVEKRSAASMQDELPTR